MPNYQTERVDIHNLVPLEEEWELFIYQSPSVLKVRDPVLAKRLEEALCRGESIEITWDSDSGEVLSQ